MCARVARTAKNPNDGNMVAKASDMREREDDGSGSGTICNLDGWLASLEEAAVSDRSVARHRRGNDREERRGEEDR